MALDRYEDGADGPRDVRPEQHRRHGGSAGDAPAVGIHARGRGPGDSFSLPYFEVIDLAGALARVTTVGGTVIHPGERWAVCRDSEGTPFGLAQRSP